jgi:hypothetical protein
MKKTAVSAILLVGLLAFLAPSPVKAYVSVSISFFQQELAPYGDWVVTSRYGHCWHPRVHRHWRPYWNGEWVWTDYGWTWVSYDPWGDDPFHYGTWVWVDDDYGWCWEPGYVWAPAWVTWSYTDDFIGWAPVPATFDIGVTGYIGSPVVVAQTNYVFVPFSGFVGTNISTVAVAPAQNATFLAGARNVTNFSVSGGVVHVADPPVSVVERASGKTIRKMGLTSISGHAIKPAAIAGAGLVAGKKMRVTAPASDRALAAKATAPKGAKPSMAAAKPSKGLAKPSKSEAKPPRVASAKPSKGLAKPARAEAKPPKAASAKPSKAFAKPSRAESKPPKAASAKPPKSFAKEAKPTKVAHGAPPSARGMKTSQPPKHAERTTALSHREMAPQQAAPRAVERHAAPPPRAEARPETHVARHEVPPPRMEAPQHAAPPPHAAAQPPHAGPPPQAAKPQGGAPEPKPKKEKGE